MARSATLQKSLQMVTASSKPSKATLSEVLDGSGGMSAR